MTKNFALAVFLAAMLLLLGLVWVHTGRITPPSGPASIWFNGGLLLLILGRFVTEYRFTKPNDVFLNSVSTFVGISTLSSPPLAGWWEGLRWSSALLAILAIALSWDARSEDRRESSRWRTIVYRIVVSLGRADVLFSIVFILALLSFFSLNTPETKIFVIAWGAIVLVSRLDIPALANAYKFKTRHPERVLLGVPQSYLAPSIVFCTQTGAQKPKLHQIVGFAHSGSAPCHCVGIVIGERSSAQETRIVIALLDKSVAESHLSDRSYLVTMTEAEQRAHVPPIDEATLANLSKVVGTVASGTTIAQLRFELFGSPLVSSGSMLAVEGPGYPVFFQVFEGSVIEEIAISGSSRAFVEGEAEQIGYWSDQRGGFETHDWVVRERSPVFLQDGDDQGPNYELNSAEMQLGWIPQSNYPVNIDLKDFVLFHSAILGVTGAGKSFLTYSIIEACSAQNIKVLCLDPTGDYQRYLHDAVMVKGPGALTSFLDSTDHWVGIVETGSSSVNPIKQAFEAARASLDWCRRTRPEEDILQPKPRLLLVLEEAHLLAPEWNFNPQQDLQKVVNQTSQIVLQARKYDLGVLVVSQRTANVTKSILNQCNTVVSFQAFDETGFDFLRNYMGPFHVRALPSLKPRHGILVGKASRSRRPVMVKLTDQDRELRAEPAPDIVVPNAEAAEAAGGPHIQQF